MSEDNGNGGMTLRAPKKKKTTISEENCPLPIRFGEDNELIVYTAYLNACGCSVTDPEEMNVLSSMGCFGKGSLSKNNPNFKLDSFESRPVVRRRQWRRREEWLKQFDELQLSKKGQKPPGDDPTTSTASQQIINLDDSGEVIIEDEERHSVTETIDLEPPTVSKIEEITLDSDDDLCEIIDESKTSDPFMDLTKPKPQERDNLILREHLVIQDSDSDTENYMKTIKPEIKKNGFPISETLMLTFEETFFLLYGLGCINLINPDGEEMDIEDAWNYFNICDPLFLPKYVIYHHFRSKGWVVKPGIKFGADFLLYKDGPKYYHASYMVMVESVDGDTLTIIPEKSTRAITWGNILQANRLAEITGKEVLLAHVVWPSSIPRNQVPIPIESLPEFRVQELLWRRWKPNQNQENPSDDDDDSS